ncbi:tyrosine-protein phosphatase Lar-like [Saccoglossus kowalevskii]
MLITEDYNNASLENGDPIINSIEQHSKSNAGQATGFKCTVQGNVINAEDITLTTLKQSYTYSNSNEGTHPDYIMTNTFDGVVVRDDDVVTCHVDALAGETDYYIEAEAFTQPVLSNAPRLDDIDITKMTVTWDAWNDSVDSGEGPITKYEVWYTRVDENEFQLYDECDNTTTTMTVSGLQSNAAYCFAIKTYRPGEGGGGGLSPNVTNTTLCSTPNIVTNIEASAVSAFSINVTWSEPILKECPLEGYEVKYRQSTYYECRPLQLFDPVILPSTVTEYIIIDLYPDTEYNVTVSAFTNGGSGEEANVIQNTHLTGPSIPKNVNVMGTSETSLNVTWQEPTCHNGEIIGYRFAYWETENSNRILNDSVLVEDLDEGLHYELQYGLTHTTTYTVQACSLT